MSKRLLTEKSQSLGEAFRSLIDKAEKRFRSLPQDTPTFGRKAWRSSFVRVLELLVTAWRVQQEHRLELQKPEVHGLTREQTGDIASHLGQLFFHTYLRTSDVRHLHRCFVFYLSIRNRGYFTDAKDSKKVLRYSTRFLFAAVLLNQRPLIRQLIDGMERSYKDDMDETSRSALNDLRRFIKEEGVVTVKGMSEVSYRMPVSDWELRKATASQMFFHISECMIVENRKVLNVPRFSELTLDTLRMMQTVEFEREPLWREQHSVDLASFGEGNEVVTDKGLPRHTVMYHPSSTEFLEAMAVALRDCDTHGGVMLYYCGDHRDGSCLLQDIYPVISRKQCIVFLESNPDQGELDQDYSWFFGSCEKVDVEETEIARLPSTCLCLLGAVSHSEDTQRGGSWTTHFVSNPVLAMARLCGVTTLSSEMYRALEAHTREGLEAVYRSSTPGKLPMLVRQMTLDKHVRLLWLRFVLCCTALARHFSVRESVKLPRIVPPLPQTIQDDLEHNCEKYVLKVLIEAFHAEDQFEHEM